jgi:hypothetical protein
MLRPWEIRTYIAVVAATFVLLSYWTLFDNQPASKFIKSEFIPKQIKQGGDIKLEGQLVRVRLCPRTEITRTLIDSVGARHILSDVVFNGPAGPLGPDTFKQTLHIPDTAREGPAELTLVTAWYCNPMHSLLSRPITRRDQYQIEILPK